MTDICFYFQIHQPLRLRKYTVFDIGNNHNYYNEQANKEIMQRIANKCYLPMNNIILDLIKKNNKKFKVSFSITGTALEQFEMYSPEVIESFKELADTGCVDFLSETYYHSISFLYSKEEFLEQVSLHKKKIKELFNIEPIVFRNTELIFNNEIAQFIEKQGFKGILSEGADHVLEWRSPNYLYKPKGTENISLMLKNYKLSDDIAFRFSNRAWTQWPLTPEKYSKWINSCEGNSDVINLFMDYETFGEHQWKETGIFDFMKDFPKEYLKNKNNNFITVRESIEKYKPVSELDIFCPISWADAERDLSAWIGNKIQVTAIQRLYEFEKIIKETNDKELIKDWRNLTTSDHLYYMCTKWFQDGDVHKYFNPYDSPYDAFIIFMNVLNDIEIRIGKILPKEKIITK
jgi:alpha-amylase